MVVGWICIYVIERDGNFFCWWHGGFSMFVTEHRDGCCKTCDAFERHVSSQCIQVVILRNTSSKYYLKKELHSILGYIH